MTSTHVADCALQAFRSLAVAGLLSSAAIARCPGRGHPRLQVRGLDGGPRAGLRDLPRPERPGHQQRVLSPHRRQARRLSLQPAGRVSRRQAGVPADELPGGLSAGRLSARDRRAFRQAAAGFEAEAADHRDAAVVSRGADDRHRGRCEQAGAGLHRLPRRRADGHGAGHPRPRRACGRPTSSRSSRGGAPATGTPPNPIA